MARTQRTPPIPNMGYKLIKSEELGTEVGRLHIRIVLIRMVSSCAKLVDYLIVLLVNKTYNLLNFLFIFHLLNMKISISI